jgi:hypothetical protein
MFDSVAATRAYGFSVSHPSVKINHNLSSHLRRQPSPLSTLPTTLDTPQQLRNQQHLHPHIGHNTQKKNEKESENEKEENMNEDILIEEEEEDGSGMEYQQLLDEDDDDEERGEEDEVTNTTAEVEGDEDEIPIEGEEEDSDGDSSFDFLDDSSKNASEDGDGDGNQNGEGVREPRGPHGRRQSEFSKKAERMFRALLGQGREKELCGALEALLCQEGERGKGGKVEEEEEEEEELEEKEEGELEEKEEEEASEKLMEGILDIEVPSLSPSFSSFLSFHEPLFSYLYVFSSHFQLVLLLTLFTSRF